MKKLIKLADVKDLLPLLDKEKITLNRFAELLNERANKALNIHEVIKYAFFDGANSRNEEYETQNIEDAWSEFRKKHFL